MEPKRKMLWCRPNFFMAKSVTTLSSTLELLEMQGLGPGPAPQQGPIHCFVRQSDILEANWPFEFVYPAFLT